MFVCFNAFCIFQSLHFALHTYIRTIDPEIIIIIIIITDSQQIMEAHSLNLHVYSFNVG